MHDCNNLCRMEWTNVAMPAHPDSLIISTCITFGLYSTDNKYNLLAEVRLKQASINPASTNTWVIIFKCFYIDIVNLLNQICSCSTRSPLLLNQIWSSNARNSFLYSSTSCHCIYMYIHLASQQLHVILYSSHHDNSIGLASYHWLPLSGNYHGVIPWLAI